ncbi:MAG: DUF4129 domain-containing protein [Dehalococcoidia bacterium]|nr:DUF4129 domain-containing protein [Dehalococcoidia bacterium]
MSRWRVLVLGLTLVALLGMLAAGLQTLEFRPGLPMPELDEPAPGESLILPFPRTLMGHILDLTPWIILGIVILGAVVYRRKLVKEVFRLRLLIVLMVLLAVFGLRPGQTELPAEQEELFENGQPAQLVPALPSPDDWATDGTEQQPVALPDWVTYLAAVALAVPLVLLGWWLARQAARRYRKREEEEELRQVAAQAAADLRAGLSAEEVVIRCWARMAEIVAGRAGGSAPAFTPRELTQLLARWGVRHEAIAELTRLFEEVRYGAKADAPRRERALAALAAIEEAYGVA